LKIKEEINTKENIIRNQILKGKDFLEIIIIPEKITANVEHVKKWVIMQMNVKIGRITSSLKL